MYQNICLLKDYQYKISFLKILDKMWILAGFFFINLDNFDIYSCKNECPALQAPKFFGYVGDVGSSGEKQKKQTKKTRSSSF